MIVETIEVKENMQAIVEIDELAESPREWDNLSFMICFHKRYNLGDNHDLNHHDYDSWDDMLDHIIRIYNVATFEPLYMYDHSGITISTEPFSCPWDSGQIGWCIVTKDAIKEAWGVKKVTKKLIQKAKEVMLSEIKIYDSYLQGDVYGVRIIENNKEIDSCWGFIGMDSVNEFIEEFK